MRAAPPFQVSLQRFGAWRGAVWLLAALGTAAITAWLIAHQRPIETLVLVAAGFSMLVLAVLVAALVKMPAANLRWDGILWHLGPSSGDPVPGDVVVAIDLGPWMLLRFSPISAGPRTRVRWLPVQRRGIESHWHALRCAVYSPRPAPAGEIAIGP